MKITEVPKIELPNGKEKIAIDLFTKMIRDISIKDNVEIEINVMKYLLEIKGKAYDVVVQDTMPKRIIVDNIFNIKLIKSISEDEYKIIRFLLLEEFEKIEQDEKSEFDEHWEFVELGGM